MKLRHLFEDNPGTGKLAGLGEMKWKGLTFKHHLQNAVLSATQGVWDHRGFDKAHAAAIRDSKRFDDGVKRLKDWEEEEIADASAAVKEPLSDSWWFKVIPTPDRPDPCVIDMRMGIIYLTAVARRNIIGPDTVNLKGLFEHRVIIECDCFDHKAKVIYDEDWDAYLGNKIDNGVLLDMTEIYE